MVPNVITTIPAENRKLLYEAERFTISDFFLKI